MDATRFDHLTRAFSTAKTPRRQALGTLLLGAFTARVAAEGVAAGPGCKNVGKKCQKKKDCCSGVCKGKKGKKKCKAHDTGGCQAGQNILDCGGAANVPCTTSAGSEGFCRTTTGKAGYCGASISCWECQRDADCVPLCGPQAACITCTGCTFDGGTACAAPASGSCAMV